MATRSIHTLTVAPWPGCNPLVPGPHGHRQACLEQPSLAGVKNTRARAPCGSACTWMDDHNVLRMKGPQASVKATRLNGLEAIRQPDRGPTVYGGPHSRTKGRCRAMCKCPCTERQPSDDGLASLSVQCVDMEKVIEAASSGASRDGRFCPDCRPGRSELTLHTISAGRGVPGC
jgi:hypothetical protein